MCQEVNWIETYLQESIDVYVRMAADAGLLSAIAKLSEIGTAAILANRKILFAGNGGSAADAQHFAGELVSRFYYDRPSIASIALTTDTSILTAIGNDYGYEYSFARQIEALGQEGDVFIGISTSGMSSNILAALKAARAKRLTVIGFTGKDGGKMAALCDLEIRIPSNMTPLIQQGHLLVGHMFCAMIEKSVYPRNSTRS